MTLYNPGDVVLVRFPFTDLSTTKKRPALVVSPAAFTAKNGDLVVLAMTGQSQTDGSLRLQNWKSAGLLRPTWFKPLIGTLAAGLVRRTLGKLGAKDQARAKMVIRRLIAPEFL
jgi:mRNA interferase MazF